MTDRQPSDWCGAPFWSPPRLVLLLLPRACLSSPLGNQKRPIPALQTAFLPCQTYPLAVSVHSRQQSTVCSFPTAGVQEVRANASNPPAGNLAPQLPGLGRHSEKGRFETSRLNLHLQSRTQQWLVLVRRKLSYASGLHRDRPGSSLDKVRKCLQGVHLATVCQEPWRVQNESFVSSQHRCNYYNKHNCTSSCLTLLTWQTQALQRVSKMFPRWM